MPNKTLKGGSYVTCGPWDNGSPYTASTMDHWDNFTVDPFGNPVDPLFLPAYVEVGGEGTHYPLAVQNLGAVLMVGYRVKIYTLEMRGLTTGSGDTLISYPNESFPLFSETDSSETVLLQDMQDVIVNGASSSAPTMAGVGHNVSAYVSGFYALSTGGITSTCFMNVFVTCAAGSTFQSVDPEHIEPPQAEAGVACNLVLPGFATYGLTLYGQGAGSITITASEWWGYNGRYSTSDGTPL